VGVKYPPLEKCKQLFGLLRIQLVDILGERTHSVYALPSRDGVCAYDRVYRGQVGSNILRCATWPFVYNNMFRIGRSSFQEPITNECRCQALEEFAVWFGESGKVVSES